MKAVQSSMQIILTAAIGLCLAFLLVIGLPWVYFAGFLVVTGFLLIFFINPLLFLGILLFFRAAIDSFLVHVRFAVGGTDLGLAGGFSLLLVLLTLIAFITERDETVPARLNHPLIWLYAAFCLFSILNSLYSYDKTAAYKVVLRVFSILSVMMLVVMKVKKKEDAYFLFKTIAWSFVPSVVIGFLTGVSFYQEIRGARYCATLSHPNILAFYLLVIITTLLTGLHHEHGDLRTRRLTLIGMFLLVTMLVFTKTRSGYAASAILFLIYCLMKNRRLILPLIFAAACLAALPVVKNQIASLYQHDNGKVTLNEDSSFAWRLQKSGYLFKEAVKKPLIGHGMGASYHFGNDRLAAHDDYAQFFLEGGIVGLFLYFGPYFMLLGTALRTKKRTDPDSLLFRISDFFLIFVPPFLIMSVSENLASYVTIHWYLWAIVGIFISLSWRFEHADRE